MVTIEAELCKKLNLSWADARDLASYAAAIEADKLFPRKRSSSKAHSGCLDSPECPKLDAGDQNIVAPKRNFMRAGRGNVVVKNKADVAQEGQKANEDLGACTTCMQCFNTLGQTVAPSLACANKSEYSS